MQKEMNQAILKIGMAEVLQNKKQQEYDSY